MPSIRRVFKIINSCENQKQLRTCEKLADYYTQLARSRGVVNYELIRETLYIKINERKEEIGLAHRFRGKIRRKKIKFEEVEKELVENFS